MKKNVLYCTQIILIVATVGLIVSLHFLYEIELIAGNRSGYWFSIPTNSSTLIDLVLYFSISIQMVLVIVNFMLFKNDGLPN